MNLTTPIVQGRQPTFGDLVKAARVTKTTLARRLGLSIQTVNTWVELNAVPPRHIIKVANVLDREVSDLLDFAHKTYKPVKTTKKTVADLDALNEAYHGRPHDSALSEHAIKLVLKSWGGRFPLLYDTLKALHARDISSSEAAERLGVSVSTVHGLRRRYGIAPGRLKSQKKPIKKKEINEKLCKKLAVDVLSGRKTVVSAAKEAEISLRTLHRHIAALIRPLTLNQISHWSTNFRWALAHEISHGLPMRAKVWRLWAEQKGYDLPRKPRWPKAPTTREGWRKLNARQMAVQVMTGNISLIDLAHERGGEVEVLRGLLCSTTANITDVCPLEAPVSHQFALAEVLVALDGPRRPELYQRAEPVRPEELKL